MDFEIDKKRTKNKKLIRGISFFILSLLLLVIMLYMHIFGSSYVETPKRISVPEGYSLIKTANLLEEQKIINSALGLRILARTQDISVKAGDYIFEGDQIPMKVLERLDSADYGDVYISVTIPEGSTIKQIANIYENSNLEKFDVNFFLENTKGLEGYLFPDTYSFLPSASTQDIIDVMQTTFNAYIKDFEEKINASNRSLEDIIIMASIIEKEATGDLKEQRTISGILWKRLDEGKLLQIDAPFLYINGRVRATDLRKDGPYNTYTRTGLTPTPIGNPGAVALEAAMNPFPSPYYFYLHGKDGVVRYGKTYNQHINNINQYLR